MQLISLRNLGPFLNNSSLFTQREFAWTDQESQLIDEHVWIESEKYIVYGVIQEVIIIVEFSLILNSWDPQNSLNKFWEIIQYILSK